MMRRTELLQQLQLGRCQDGLKLCFDIRFESLDLFFLIIGKLEGFKGMRRQQMRAAMRGTIRTGRCIRWPAC